jgi:hypothetical protein
MRPRFRLAIADGAACSTAGLSRWTHRVGVTADTLDQDSPTRDAIGLSSPVDVGGKVSMGELSPWRSILPPPGGGGQPRAG